MSDNVASAGIPEVVVGQTSPAGAGVPPEFSGAWSDFGKDMAAIEKEMGAAPAQPAQVQPPAAATPAPAQATIAAPQQQAPAAQPAPAAPAQPPVTAAAEIEVPEKFRGPDGKLDQQKLLKSYAEAEKGLKRLQNGQPAPAALTQPQGAPAPAPAAVQQGAPAPAPQAAAEPLTPFEAQVAQDLLNTAAALGQPMSQAHAIATAKVQIRLMDAKHRADVEATRNDLEAFREERREVAMKTELDQLAASQPWVMTPQGQAELVRARQENPWLNNSAQPWTAAVYHVLGQKQLAGGPSQVPMPNPAGVQQTGSAPLPVTPASTPSAPIALNTPADVEAYVKTLNSQQEAEFWRLNGFKWGSPVAYKGI